MDLVSVPHQDQNQNPSKNNQYSVKLNDKKYEVSPFLENNQSLCASGFYHDHETNECKDINECTFESHLCSNEKFKCINTEGSYFCADFSCPKLYIDRSAKVNKKIKDVYSEKFCVRSRCTDLDQRCLSSPLIIRKNYHVKYLSRGFLYGGTHSASIDPSLVFEENDENDENDVEGSGKENIIGITQNTTNSNSKFNIINQNFKMNPRRIKFMSISSFIMDQKLTDQHVSDFFELKLEKIRVEHKNDGGNRTRFSTRTNISVIGDRNKLRRQIGSDSGLLVKCQIYIDVMDRGRKSDRKSNKSDSQRQKRDKIRGRRTLMSISYINFIIEG